MEILLVEDNPADAQLVAEALDTFEVQAELNTVADGEEAIAYLRRQGRFSNSPRPDLVLLDLNLPRMNGHEVLQQVKADPDLLRIPVVVLSSSTLTEDVRRSYDLHANCFVVKPMGFAGFTEVIRTIERFWRTIVCLPRR